LRIFIFIDFDLIKKFCSLFTRRKEEEKFSLQECFKFSVVLLLCFSEIIKNRRRRKK